MGIEETLIAFVVLGGPLLLMAFWLYLRASARRNVMDLVRHAVDQGKPMDAEMIELLDAGSTPTPDRDLRRGCILIGVGVATCVFAFIVDEEVLFGIAAFPGIVGLAYLAFSKRGRSTAEG